MNRMTERLAMGSAMGLVEGCHSLRLDRSKEIM